jgi:hypothetical protein
MKKELNYYEKELLKIDNIKALSVKFTGWEDSTKELNINLESIKAIKKFLSKIEKELLKDKTK